MKNSIIIAVFIAFGAILNGNAANPTPHTTVIHTDNATTTRTQTPFHFMNDDFWRIIIRITFSRPMELEIEFEGIMAGGNSDGNASAVAGNVSLANGLVNFTVPENTNGLAGVKDLRVVKGGRFKTANGQVCEIKVGQVLRMLKPYSFQCPYSVVATRDATSGAGSKQ